MQFPTAGDLIACPYPGFVRLPGTEAFPARTECLGDGSTKPRDNGREKVASGALRIRATGRLHGLGETSERPRSLRPKRITQMWLSKALYKVSAGRSLDYHLTGHLDTEF